MSLDVKITKRLESGYVQVDVQSKNALPKYYKVPENNANNFIQEYQAVNKNYNTVSNIIYFASIIGGIFAASRFTKNIEKFWHKMAIETCAGIGTGVAGVYLMNEFIKNKNENIKSKYHAKEIFYRA